MTGYLHRVITEPRTPAASEGEARRHTYAGAAGTRQLPIQFNQ